MEEGEFSPKEISEMFNVNVEKLKNLWYIYKKTGVLPSKINGRNGRYVKKISDKDIEEIIELRKQGYKHEEIAKKFGIGKSHSKAERVERILQLHFSKNGITLSDRPPLYLELSLDKDARNWEGIARLDTLGFLIITDTYPRTIFGFVRSSL